MSTAPDRSLSIDRGSPADAPAITALMAAAFDPRFGEAWTLAQVGGVFSLPGVTLTLARVGGALAGFAMVRSVVDDAELLLLATHPDHRRTGIGRALVDAAVDALADKGVTQLHLEVRANNSAIELYRAIGFEAVGRRRNYYRGNTGESFDALTFSLPVVAKS